MSKTVWLITGAGRGMGTDIAKAALAAGHAVVATGRDPERVTAAIGAHDDLLAVKLDVTNPDDATAAAQAAVDRFGRVDVLVNNAGNFIAGFFEEVSPDDFRAQIETNLIGPLNVARAVLPVWPRETPRRPRRGGAHRWPDPPPGPARCSARTRWPTVASAGPVQPASRAESRG